MSQRQPDTSDLVRGVSPPFTPSGRAATLQMMPSFFVHVDTFSGATLTTVLQDYRGPASRRGQA